MHSVTAKQKQYLAAVNNRIKMGFFFLVKLPSLFFWRVKIEEASNEHCIISIPYNWTTQNPFSSIYFAAQLGAAELASGLLVTLATKAHQRKVAMYVVDSQAQFTKKATERIYFRNDQGAEIQAAVDRCINTNEAQTIDCVAVGETASGQKIGQLRVTWSLKAK